jgi:nucleotide-binding universal stress UspA family protein
MLAEAMVFGSGRPTIIVPEGAEASGISRIAIAWDGSRVAARALADATRLLERAEEMHVITVTDEKPLADKAAGDRLAEGLRQAGVKASFSPIRAEDCPIAETLQRHALELDAQLLVMGGYGHSGCGTSCSAAPRQVCCAIFGCPSCFRTERGVWRWRVRLERLRQWRCGRPEA